MGFQSMDQPAGSQGHPPPPPAGAGGHEGGPPFVVSIAIVSLIAFGAGAFFVTQWESMPRVVRLLVLVASFIAAHGGAWLVLRRPGLLPEVGHALVLAGVALFGPALLITAQMFSAVGRLPDAVATWAAVAVLAAAVVPS
ncbi:MAG: hypothetical protein VR70_09195, partial [Rhodospirillaceae bacterium BRH_c57]